MIAYRTVKEAYCAETEIRRSRFIAIADRVRSEEELFEKLAAIRKKYSDATHVCYAAVFDVSGNAARFSDDGEPSGTAGQPILDAIKKSDLRETLVAVVRYFGGIKLGAGGLVRAYSASVVEGLKAARKVLMKPCDVYTLKTDFSAAKRFSGLAEKKGVTVLKTEYSGIVTFTLAVDNGFDLFAVSSEILCAKPDLTYIKTDYSEFPETENI